MSGAHAHRLPIAGIENGVRLHVLANFPSEKQRPFFFRRRRPLGHNFQIGLDQLVQVGILNQHASRNIFQNPVLLSGRNLDQPQILLRAKSCFGAFIECGSGDHFQKEFGHLMSGRRIHRAVHSDHAAKRRDRIALQRPHVSLGERLAGRGAAGICVFDNGAHRLVKLLRQIPGGLQIDNIVIGKLFPLHLTRIRHARARAVRIHRRFLVRILSIAQVHHFLKRQPQILRKTFRRMQFEVAAHPLQRRGDGGIIGCGGRERLLRQPPLRFHGQRRRAARAGHLLGDCAVIGGRGDDCDILKIFRRRTNHRRPADIDVLNQLVEAHARLGGGFLEGVKVDHHHVDGRDAMLGNRRAMAGVVAPMQNSPVDFRMQRLDAPIQHFREPGQLGNIFHRDAGVAQQFGRAPGRNQFHAQRGELAAEIDQSGFVSDAENGALDFRHEPLGCG